MSSPACTKDSVVHGHPCFGANRHKNGRIHLAVAPQCNIKCGYCERKHDCANESRPGVTSKLLTPQQALEKVREIIADEQLGRVIKVVGIAGPGDPLANDSTFETFRLIKAEFPELLFCMSTNGLVLPDRIKEVSEIDLHSLTVSGRRRNYFRRPPTPPCVRFRTRRFTLNVENGETGQEVKEV
ncbi:MAG TPA: radical SAM protein, partial [Desulfuromonadales bacterium]|nr:radical SAM protein [Desulfuromonadales bacterium]